MERVRFELGQDSVPVHSAARIKCRRFRFPCLKSGHKAFVGSSIPSVESGDMRATRTAALAFLIAASLAACGCKSSGPAMEHKIGLVYFAPEEGADLCMKGLFDGLKEQGIEERVNLEVRRAHAQAEIANIPLLIQNYDGSDVDVIVAMTTPVLTAAAAVAPSKPVVFTYVYAPIAAGAGKSRTDHLPNVTGVYSSPPVQDTVYTHQGLPARSPAGG